MGPENSLLYNKGIELLELYKIEQKKMFLLKDIRRLEDFFIECKKIDGLNIHPADHKKNILEHFFPGKFGSGKNKINLDNMGFDGINKIFGEFTAYYRNKLNNLYSELKKYC
jgi:hypothetical protein